jgi:uncharacterized protein (DUF1015 family)
VEAVLGTRTAKTVTMEVKPFKAFRFDPRVVGDVGKCIAPPYDVIGDSEREELYRRSDHNIVRITRGKTTSSDDAQHNQYTRAAEYLQKWIAEGAIKPDDRDTIYGYVQDFELDGVAYRRLTFIALGKLEDFGKTVRPHEQVFAKPLADRLNLKRATAARFGLVFMLYDDPQGVADKAIAKAATQKPLVDFIDDHGVRHQLFPVADEGDIQAIVRMMGDKNVIIADGHHRYTTGLAYMRETDNPAAKYQMLAFTNTAQEGLVVLATHRVVGGIDGFAPQAFLARLTPGFTLTQCGFGPDASVARASSPCEEHGQDGHATKESAKQCMLKTMKDVHERDETPLGIYMGDGNFHVAVLKDKSLMRAAAPDKSEAWQTLDVSVLQKLILEGMLGLTEEQMGNSEYVEYVKDTPNAIDEIIRTIDSGRKQVAFFTNPVKMQQLARIADAGERMPHKSTYFYPKMYTGLTIQKL